jgi:hypothetical protein
VRADLRLPRHRARAPDRLPQIDYHLGDVNNESNEWRTKAGGEFTSAQNFFTQILYDDVEKHARLQMGWGF